MGGILTPNPPVNGPGAYERLVDQRLTSNSNLTKMPTNQREWNSFIQELNKWIKSETGFFDVGGSADAQFTGFSSDPTSAGVWWMRYGQFVHMEFNFTTGTSNTTGFTITGVPENLTPRDNLTVPCEGLIDNNTLLTAGTGTCRVNANSTLDFRTTPQGGTWTALLGKGFDLAGRYGIIYPLRQPGKQ